MTQIEVTFLGTTAAIPTKFRNHASVYLRYQSENEFFYLFDCGEGTQRQIFSSGLNFMRINDIFISHWHADHFAGLLGLMQTMNLEDRQKELNIYGPEAGKFVPTLLSLGYGSKNYQVRYHNVEFEGTEQSKILETNEFAIVSVPMKHSVPAVAYAFVEKDRVKIDKEKSKKLGLPAKGHVYAQIKEKGSALFKGRKIMLDDIALVEKGKKVVYSGDTLINNNMKLLAEGADLLIHDATFLEEDRDKMQKHTSVEEVLQLASEANVKQLVLTHISRRYQNTDKIKDVIKDFPNAKIAKDFMKITLA
jgi:ribonuclease Z